MGSLSCVDDSPFVADSWCCKFGSGEEETVSIASLSDAYAFDKHGLFVGATLTRVARIRLAGQPVCGLDGKRSDANYLIKLQRLLLEADDLRRLLFFD